MARPRMVVIAGPPGAGKSVAFPVAEEGIDFFDADDRCAAIHGSYQGITPEVRNEINAELRTFIADHIRDRKSFAFETTFQNPIFFEQAQQAQAAGFRVELTYMALHDVKLHIERVAARADRGGHSAPPSDIENIYENSMKNLPRALHAVEHVEVLDNTSSNRAPEILMITCRGQVQYLHPDAPKWLEQALQNTEYDLSRLNRNILARGSSSEQLPTTQQEPLDEEQER